MGRMITPNRLLVREKRSVGGLRLGSWPEFLTLTQTASSDEVSFHHEVHMHSVYMKAAGHPRASKSRRGVSLFDSVM